MKLQFNIKDLSNKLQPLVQKARRYIILIFILSLALVFGFLLIRIGMLAESEPSQTAIDEKLTSVKRPKVDQNAIDKIKQLEETNVEVQSLFNQARDNPFQE